MKLKVAQVIGLNTDQKAAQVSFSQRGEEAFTAVIDLASDDAFTKGRQVLSELADFYFDFEGTPAEKLAAAFAEAENKIPTGTDYSLCLGAISSKVLYLIGKGQVEVYLKREGKLSSLLSIGTAAQLISGFISSSDRLLFSTSSLASFLGNDLDKSLSLPLETLEEEIGGKIGVSDLENQSLAALVIETAEENPPIANLSSADHFDTKEEPKKYLPLVNLKEQIASLLTKLPGYLPQNGKGRLILAGILLAVILSGAGYRYKLQSDQKTKVKFEQALQQARDDFNAAKGLSSLNPAEAKNKLDFAESNINKALTFLPKESSALDLKKLIEAETPNILQQLSVNSFPLFLDLDLVKKNFRANQMSLSKDKLLLLDPGAKTLILVDLSKKSNQILAGSEQLGEAVAASLNGGLAFVYSQDKGILKIDAANSKLTAVAKKDSGWGKIQDIYGFAGNVYLLDIGSQGQIWKYLPTEQGYSDKREYLSKTVKADFSEVTRMQIESSIYLLKSRGEILRFTKGEKDNFSFKGLPANIKNPKSIFTSSDTDNLYVLDNGNSRMLTLSKTGEFKGEVKGSKFATATDLVVDEAGKKVYLLEGGKIFSAEFK